MMKKTDGLVTVVWFLGVLYAGAALLLLLPKQAYSEQERRYLAEVPEASGERILDGTYMTELETWLTDHFPMRDALVGVHGMYSYVLGRRDLGGMYFCDDGYRMTKLTAAEVSQAQVTTNALALRKLGECMTELGRSYHVMIVPSSSLQLAEKLPYGAELYDQDAVLNHLKEMLGERAIDLRDVLTEDAHYYKTDHHWTTEGAYEAYLAYCEVVGRTPTRKDCYTELAVTEHFRGTLYAKAPIALCEYDTVTVYKKDETLTVVADGKALPGLYDETALAGEDAYRYFLGGNYGTLTIQSELDATAEGAQRCLLVIKDSYANCFLPFLTGDYAEIHVLDMRYYNGFIKEYAGKNRITDVLVLYGADGYVVDENVPKLALGLTAQIDENE